VRAIRPKYLAYGLKLSQPASLAAWLFGTSRYTQCPAAALQNELQALQPGIVLAGGSERDLQYVLKDLRGASGLAVQSPPATRCRSRSHSSPRKQKAQRQQATRPPWALR
jgi:hypothetical protein